MICQYVKRALFVSGKPWVHPTLLFLIIASNIWFWLDYTNQRFIIHRIKDCHKWMGTSEIIDWLPKFATGLNMTIGCSSKIIWLTRLLFCQNGSPMRGSFWQKNSFITHILFELQPIIIFSPVANFGNQSILQNLMNIDGTTLISFFCPLRSLQHWLLQKLSMKFFDQFRGKNIHIMFLIKNRYSSALIFQEHEYFYL